ncbi:hypothetical protein [Paraburkholderia sp. BL6669N2]|uniref:hypothetical protein n=1 Tax=Paraburkholderia sp. BL6669N2 TaxID=1938807 RepID=UPI0011C0629D|nr:hypothetical protein [Paraburkholderia sp. BL6669N2]
MRDLTQAPERLGLLLAYREIGKLAIDRPRRWWRKKKGGVEINGQVLAKNHRIAVRVFGIVCGSFSRSRRAIRA